MKSLQVAVFVFIAVLLPANLIGLVFYAHTWGRRTAFIVATAGLVALLVINRDFVARRAKDKP